MTKADTEIVNDLKTMNSHNLAPAAVSKLYRPPIPAKTEVGHMADPQKIEPCPHCDGEASLRTGGPGLNFVQCDTCNCTSDDGSKDRVIAAWNRRTTPPEREVLEAAVNDHLDECERIVGREVRPHEMPAWWRRASALLSNNQTEGNT